MINTDLHVEDLILSDKLKDLPMLAKYDESFKELVEQVFAGSVILAPYERAFDLFITQKKEDLKFPFISLFPTQGYTIINGNFAQTNIGIPALRAANLYNDNTLSKEGSSKVMQNFHQLLYFNIPYQLECWGNNRMQALQLVQELLFWFKAQGQVLVDYKNVKYTCNLTVNETITDNSSYTEYENLGNVYRFTIQLTIEAPVFRTQNYLNVNQADLTLKMKED